MVISKPIRQNKVSAKSTHDIETKKPTQKELILEWIHYNPNEFLANDLVKEFPNINRRVIEKIIKERVVLGKIESHKCQCGCANIYKDIKPDTGNIWT